jgi:hypothetical protein
MCRKNSACFERLAVVAVLAFVALIVVGCQSAQPTAKAARQTTQEPPKYFDQTGKEQTRQWFKDQGVDIEPPDGNCPATKITFRRTQGPTVYALAKVNGAIRIDVRAVKRLVVPPDDDNCLQDKAHGLGPSNGDEPDLLITDGWLYVLGVQLSGGSATVAAAADASKFIISVPDDGAPQARAHRARVISPANEPDNTCSWRVRNPPSGPKTAVPPGKATEGDGQQRGRINRPHDPGGTENAIIDEVARACDACGINDKPTR